MTMSQGANLRHDAMEMRTSELISKFTSVALSVILVNFVFPLELYVLAVHHT